MTRNLPPALRNRSQPAPAPTPSTPDAPAASAPTSPTTDAADGVTSTTLIIVVDSAQAAKQLQSAKAWATNQPRGSGQVTVRVVISPDPETSTDEEWLMTQLAELGIAKPADISAATMLFWPKQ